MENLKKHDRQGLTQFELSHKLLNNLSQFSITPTAKLVLMYLAGCFNPQKKDIFPKQKTIAQKIGVSERSVVRAICELVKAGLILIECKYTNRYKFTPYFLSSLGISHFSLHFDEMSDKTSQNGNCINDKMSAHDIEPIKEHKKEQITSVNSKSYSFDEFKILKDYAKKQGAKNINAYVKTLINNGASQKIITDFKKQKAIEMYHAMRIKETTLYIKELKNSVGVAPQSCPAWVEFNQKRYK